MGCRREGVRVTAPGSRLRGRHARTETRGRVSSAGSSIKNTTGGGGVLKCPLSPPSTILRWLRVSPARLDSYSGPLRINQNTGLLNRPPDGARPASPAAPRSPATQTRPWETAGQGPARWRLPCQVGEAGQPCGPQEEASRGGRRSPRLPLAPSGLFHERHESPFRVRHFNLESLSKQLRFAVTETTLSSRQTSHIPARSATRAVCT